MHLLVRLVHLLVDLLMLVCMLGVLHVEVHMHILMWKVVMVMEVGMLGMPLGMMEMKGGMSWWREVWRLDVVGFFWNVNFTEVFDLLGSLLVTELVLLDVRIHGPVSNVSHVLFHQVWNVVWAIYDLMRRKRDSNLKRELHLNLYRGI